MTKIIADCVKNTGALETFCININIGHIRTRSVQMAPRDSSPLERIKLNDIHKIGQIPPAYRTTGRPNKAVSALIIPHNLYNELRKIVVGAHRLTDTF